MNGKPPPVRRSLLALAVLAVLMLAVCSALYEAGFYVVHGHWAAW